MDKSSQQELSKAREKIDKLDNELLDLLNQRARLSVHIGKIKKTELSPIFCRPERESEIIKNLLHNNTGPLEHENIEKIFKLIFAISLELQQKA